jgi:flagellar secretion chaperone FliS
MAMNPYAQYVDNQVMTSTPGKLLLMTYDAAIRFTRTALECMKKKNLYEQNENIKKARNALLSLISALNHDADPKLAANLDALYRYCFDKLTQANIHDNQESVTEVIGILTELRAVWAQADLAAKSESARAA